MSKLYDADTMVPFTVIRDGKEIEMEVEGGAWADSGGREEPPDGETRVTKMVIIDEKGKELGEFSYDDLTEAEMKALDEKLHQAAYESYCDDMADAYERHMENRLYELRGK